MLDTYNNNNNNIKEFSENIFKALIFKRMKIIKEDFRCNFFSSNASKKTLFLS